ncbi:sodium:solute symporter family protein [Oscillospiraceae bacterium OttesenSCG-928-G22]|nr:sodium:solute symporter family protein [Oscillospiraceae bacterium OttesenSCG-928-G22]
MQLAIVVVYFALTIAVGFYAKGKSGSSHAFTGASLSVFMIVSASAGEWLGGNSTTGVSEYGFDFGISGAWFTIANGIGIIFFAFCFAKLYRSMNSPTVPGIIGAFLGVKARTVSSVFLTFVMLAVGTSQMIAAGSLGASLVGMDFNVSVLVFGVIFIIYTLAGGMNAVAYTNLVHLITMYGGVILAIVLLLMKIGGVSGFVDGIASVEAAEGGNYFGMFSIGMPKVSSWVIASLLGACTAQAAIQPVLASKDVMSARRASLITALVVAPFGLLTATLGMIAKVLSHNGQLLNVLGENVTNGKLAFPTLMMQLTPVAGGFVLAAMLAAVSTVSPLILAAGTMLTKDIYQGVFRPDADDKRMLLVSRITTAISGLVCCGLAIFFNASGIRVLDIVYFAYSMRGALFIVVLLGIYYKKTSERGAVYGMYATAAVGLFWVIYNAATGHFPIHPAFSETYAAVIVAFVTTLLFSRVFPDKTERQRPAILR